MQSLSLVEVKKFDSWRTSGLAALAIVGSFLGWELTRVGAAEVGTDLVTLEEEKD